MLISVQRETEIPKVSEVPKAFVVALWILYGVGLFSVLGYAGFGRNPQWLSVFSGQAGQWASWFYSISFRLFGEGQIWLMTVVLLAYVSSQVGWRWLPTGLVVVGLSLASEMAGTLYGVPFGAYSYSKTLLGLMFWNHVPVVIPVSWWMMAIPSYALAVAAYPKQPLRVVLLAALFLTLWDVGLDPAMSYLVPYWTWTHKGAFYGMPLQNWLGWYATSIVVMTAMAVGSADRWISKLSLPWLCRFYLLNLLVPFGMMLVAGLWLGVLVNLLAGWVCLFWLLPPHLRIHRWWAELSTSREHSSHA